MIFDNDEDQDISLQHASGIRNDEIVNSLPSSIEAIPPMTATNSRTSQSGRKLMYYTSMKFFYWTGISDILSKPDWSVKNIKMHVHGH